MADKPPLLSIVHRQTDAEIAIGESQNEIEYRTRQVAANMLRIMAGAGRPFDLFEQMRRLHQAIGSVHPDTLVGQITEAMVAGLTDNDHGPMDEFERPVETMERGALRKAASRLVGQRTQEAAGDSLIWEGIRALERLREEQRREREASARKPSAPPKKRIKQRAAPTPKTAPKRVLAPAPVAESDEKLPGESTSDYMRRQSGRQ